MLIHVKQDGLQNYIEEKRVAGELLERLNRLSGEDEVVLSALIADLNPSANTLRGILRLADEIVRRDACTLAQVFSFESLRDVLENERFSRKEKQKHIRLVLEGLRYPESRKIKDLLALQQEHILQDLGFRIELPRELEGDAVSLSISARSPEQFRDIGDKLKALSEHDAVRKIFSVLKGEW